MEQWQAELDEQEQHAEDVERFIRKCKQNIHISYDLLGILPELNTPANEEMV